MDNLQITPDYIYEVSFGTPERMGGGSSFSHAVRTRDKNEAFDLLRNGKIGGCTPERHKLERCYRDKNDKLISEVYDESTNTWEHEI